MFAAVFSFLLIVPFAVGMYGFCTITKPKRLAMTQIGLSLFALDIAIFVFTLFKRDGEGLPDAPTSLMIAFLAILPLILVAYAPRYKKNEIAKAQRAADEQRRFRDSILKTKIIDTSHTVTQESKVRTGSALGRAIVGDWVAGPVGAIVGSATAKEKVTTHEKHTTTFMVYYKDGQRQHQTVNNGTALYNLYMEKLDLD